MRSAIRARAVTVTAVESPTMPPPAPSPLVGRTLGGRYRVVAQIGEGGMGAVYRAEQLRLERYVAIKVLAMSLAHDPACLERFRREAEVVSRLTHPNIVSLLDYDVDADGSPYLVMELLVGETLADRVEREGMMDAAAVARVIGEIASGLEAAHDAGVVHRDLKPENVFLVRGPRGREAVKLLDFGISKRVGPTSNRITGAQALVGSPPYMAPEQILTRDDEVGFHTDQYALGAIAYELFAGRAPFEGTTMWQIFAAALDGPPAPLTNYGVPEEVDRVVQRALAKRPADRFKDVGELAAALRRCVGATSLPPDTLRSAALPASSSGVRVALADADDIVSELAAAMTDFAGGRLRDAWKRAEQAVKLAQDRRDPAASALLGVSVELIERIHLARVGGLGAVLTVTRMPTRADTCVSPQMAYVLSRVDGMLTVGELIDLAPLGRLEMLRALTHLLDAGFVAGGGP